MKLEECPECESRVLNRRWCSGRRLQQFCETCGWEGEKEIPEQREIETTKRVIVNHHGGFQYTIYDKYGHTYMYSKSFVEKALAIEELEKDLKIGENKDYGPFTAVLWPRFVEVHGEIFTKTVPKPIVRVPPQPYFSCERMKFCNDRNSSNCNEECVDYVKNTY